MTDPIQDLAQRVAKLEALLANHQHSMQTEHGERYTGMARMYGAEIAQSILPQPAQPAPDAQGEAALEAIGDILRSAMGTSRTKDDEAAAILAAIRANKVPGVIAEDGRSYGTILAEIDKAYRAIGALDSTDPDARDPHYIGDHVAKYVAYLKAEAEHLRAAMLSALSATRAKLNGDESTDFLCMGADEIRACIKRIEAERDKALADLALANEACAEKQAIIERFEAGERDAEELVRELKERAADAQRRADKCYQCELDAERERDAARASLAEAVGALREAGGVIRACREYSNRAGRPIEGRWKIEEQIVAILAKHGAV